jgi:phosphoglucosamine mutase
MTRQLFGTDGVRGLANSEPITAETALRLALAVGAAFNRGQHRHRAIIGKDTRLSGYMLETALTAGLLSMGMDVMLLGPLPTPAVAMLTRSMRADLGVMISASHNPYQDNGIKLFGPDGYKLSDETEAAIETRMSAQHGWNLAPSVGLGRARRIDDALGRYIEFVKSSFPKGLALDGLKVVVDCAHGAAYKAAPVVLWELGADVISLGVSPDGTNINDNLGAVHPEAMRRAVIAERAHLGLALDGDADRVVMVDETGAILDGDQLMGLITLTWAQQDRLKGGGLCATVMSNLGLERRLARQGLALYRAPVGDRYVLEEMQKRGCNVGGEQSGHIILGDYATTGDGLLAALQVLAAVVQTGRKASEVGHVFEPVPQILKNARFDANGPAPLDRAEVRKSIAEAERQLQGKGRLLVRKSGTEPVIRVMAEGDDRQTVERLVDHILETIRMAG